MKAARVERERVHGREILHAGESNWCWHTPAGQVRRRRRAELFTGSGDQSASVLEVGCGTGTFTGDLDRAFGNLTCVDVSEVLLAEARQRHPRVVFVNADIHRTEFPDATFDLIVGCSVLHHLDWGLALSEIFRILKPGGAVRFSEPNLANPQIFLQNNWRWLKERVGDSPDEYAFTAPQIRRDLERTGFVEIVARPYEFLHPSVPAKLVGAVIRFESVIQRTPLRLIGGSIEIRARKLSASAGV